MTWYNTDKLDEIKKLIDDGKVKPIKDWFWNDFKDYSTTVAVALGFVYAIENSKDSKAVTTLKNILAPKGKAGPLEFKDILSDIYKHQGMNDFIDTTLILLDNDIPFSVKSGDTAYEFLTNPKLEKVKKALETKPEIISKYMKGEEKHKIQNQLLNSGTYEGVVQALSNDLYGANNQSIRAYSKTAFKSLALATLKIKNLEFRRRYLKEHVFTKGITIENLYDTILAHYESGTYNDSQLVDLMSSLSWSNAGNGGASKFIYYLVNEGKIDTVKEILKAFDGNLLNTVVSDARMRPTMDGKPVYGKELAIEEWILEFKDELDPEVMLDFFASADDNFKAKFLNTFPQMIEKIPEKNLPDSVKDIFIF